ncbi:hypothetical protein X548_17715 [Stenotrophomonas maltophilia 5BA-I-2]|nr:hypothetical protein X548_17715 [Stenotrophomonas maltophilia 5BA-I-2]
MNARTLPVIFFLLSAVAACGKADPSHEPAAAGAIALQSLTIDSGDAHGPGRTKPFTVQDVLTVEVMLSAAPAADAGQIRARFINLATGQVASTASEAATTKQARLTLTPKNAREWEPGRYVLEVSVGNTLLTTRDVDISEPAPAS